MSVVSNEKAVTASIVRQQLIEALRLDLVGPGPRDAQAAEVLDQAPSRFYLTGFLIPRNAPAAQKAEENSQGDILDSGQAGSGDDEATPEPPAARRATFPSSIGVSVLVPSDATELRVAARWGDYRPIAKDGVPTGGWQRTEREKAIAVDVSKPTAKGVP